MFNVDFQVLSSWWENLNTAEQAVSLITTLWMIGVGAVRTARWSYGAASWGGARASAWWRKPSRITKLEGRLEALLVRLGEGNNTGRA